ncbi:hypothetical protein BDB00DRAFT_788007 [Zychaea mexicana]|uniref:uncharacterized protein n=1 Tax=Zychaea mexicana TaxID=64656 RepID=UPI0022FE53AB|nr:uncharacterized protein BDB00DRAFT_788007 [Zychaea mexicana]KAI9493319.1 hypothetical protein BDB00DRAFT_788007 [Zychaea mexicana]
MIPKYTKDTLSLHDVIRYRSFSKRTSLLYELSDWHRRIAIPGIGPRVSKNALLGMAAHARVFEKISVLAAWKELGWMSGHREREYMDESIVKETRRQPVQKLGGH